MSSDSLLAKAPCLNCRASHQKCDKRKPVCKRCEKKGLDCKPVQKKAVFRHGSSANLDASFSGGQVWVNSKPRTWRQTKKKSTPNTCPSTQTPSPWPMGDSEGSIMTSEAHVSENHGLIDPSSPIGIFETNIYEPDVEEISQDINQFHDLHEAHRGSPRAPSGSNLVSNMTPPTGTHDIQHSPGSGFAVGFKTPGLGYTRHSDRQALALSTTAVNDDAISSSSSNELGAAASEALQESCLIRYFIEELSPWFDHCDERRHFQLVVPRRARHCATLRNAVLAVSARHLCRVPQYQTSHGIFYRGQLLPNLKKSSAVEYMLKCIPDLIEFPHIQEPSNQENIMAATVILRQYEEMEEEEEMEESEIQSARRGAMNFLTITQTIIDSMSASPLDCSLATATYWITIRQEIYFALKRQTVPHLRFDADRWRNASIANTMIMFAGQVATWRWGQKSIEEWGRLRTQELQLLHDSLDELEPILDIKAERTNGKIFPTVWYSFDVQVSAIQHFRLAQMILTAENPHLDRASQTAHRKAEAQVRSLVLNICGIALCHQRIQPALVNAVIAITLYGEYFTNPGEREALIGIINIASNIRAWPMRKQYELVQRRWEMVDSAEI